MIIAKTGKRRKAPARRRERGEAKTVNIQNETARPRGTDSARVIQVIVTEALEGNGTEKDPCQIKKQYWSLEGELLAVSMGRV